MVLQEWWESEMFLDQGLVLTLIPIEHHRHPRGVALGVEPHRVRQ